MLNFVQKFSILITIISLICTNLIYLRGKVSVSTKLFVNLYKRKLNFLYKIGLDIPSIDINNLENCPAKTGRMPEVFTFTLQFDIATLEYLCILMVQCFLDYFYTYLLTMLTPTFPKLVPTFHNNYIHMRILVQMLISTFYCRYRLFDVDINILYASI